MNLIQRAKQIMLKPKEEWGVIDQEKTNTVDLIVRYLIPLALIPAVASLIGFGLKLHSFGFGIRYGILYIVTYIGGALLTAWVIDILASSFASARNFQKAMQLVVYSYTPMMVAGIVLIFPALSPIMLLAGIYSLYILYLGFKPLMKTPDDKVTTYFIVSLVVLIVVYFVISTVLMRIIIGSPLAMAGRL
ncbi:MAG: YIP1 family protein [Bacteroidales bacterium]|nr:YIP1 family protein [Bacteroidales bacterium]MBN2764243.1 YIP1 family protein [Bacteroidales bacterium]